jgi:hypothetical protein
MNGRKTGQENNEFFAVKQGRCSVGQVENMAAMGQFYPVMNPSNGEWQFCNVLRWIKLLQGSRR